MLAFIKEGNMTAILNDVFLSAREINQRDIDYLLEMEELELIRSITSTSQPEKVLHELHED